MIRFLLPALLAAALTTTAQQIPSSRRIDWSAAGRPTPTPAYNQVVNILDFGGTGDSLGLNDEAYENAVAALDDQPGVVYFPPGVYLFGATLSMRDSLIVRGAGSGATTLHFNLNSQSADCVRFQGVETAAVVPLAAPVALGDTLVGANTTLQNGIYRLKFNDSLYITSAWALGSVGQILELKQSGTVQPAIRFDIPLERQPRLQGLLPIRDAGLECLKIKRLDGPVPFTANIGFSNAWRCWISGVESEQANFAHITFDASLQCEVYGCYFHHAFAYGGGGQGYGIACQYTSTDNLVQNSIFEHLRHSILLQSGATGNVFGYNFSTDPIWEEFPNNGAGELVLHGNYPSYNLFEGNECRNIRPDGSHGANGPFNTFYRNRTTGYGFINSGSQAWMNVMGNEIVPGGLLQGLYLVSGTDHLEYGNNVGGTITPPGTTGSMDTSVYLGKMPRFLSQSNFLFGPPAGLNNGVLPARTRFFSGSEKTDCYHNEGLTLNPAQPQSPVFRLYPNPAHEQVWVETDEPVSLSVFDAAGRVVFHQRITQKKQTISLRGRPQGWYFVRVSGTMIGQWIFLAD